MVRNHIGTIRDEAGNEYVKEEEVAEVFVRYFEGLFKSNEQVDIVTVVRRKSSSKSITCFEADAGGALCRGGDSCGPKTNAPDKIPGS